LSDDDDDDGGGGGGGGGGGDGVAAEGRARIGGKSAGLRSAASLSAGHRRFVRFE